MTAGNVVPVPDHSIEAMTPSNIHLRTYMLDCSDNMELTSSVRKVVSLFRLVSTALLLVSEEDAVAVQLVADGGVHAAFRGVQTCAFKLPWAVQLSQVQLSL